MGFVGTPAPAPAAVGERELWLDAVRSIALLRVIIWHAFGVAAITYFLSAVPAMFFVTGSLLAKSLSHRSARTVLVDRARRLLVPLAAFSAVAIAAMGVARAMAPSTATELPWRGLVLWFLPVADPGGSAWEGGYLSTPLWYLRVLLWLLALSPALLRLYRWRPAMALGVPVVGVAVLEWVGRHPGWAVPWLPDLVWQAGDIALYAVFLVFGFAHRAGRLDGISAGRWLGVGAVSAIGAGGWILTQPVPAMVVNNSHPAHLLAGVAWLSVILAARGGLEALARTPRAGAAVAWVTRRTMTIYLWHALALVVTRRALAGVGELPPGVWSAALLVGTAAVMTLLVLAFGWVEDVAGRRRPQLWPGSMGIDVPSRAGGIARTIRSARVRVVGVPVAAGVVVLIVASSFVGGATAGAAGSRAPVPSQAPPRPTFKTASAGPVVDDINTSVPALFTRGGGGIAWSPRTLAAAARPDLAGALQREIERWGAAEGVPGAQVGLLRPGLVSWTGAFGVDPFSASGLTAGGLTASGRFDITSATKSFTAALLYQLADEGLVDLDAPLPALGAVPEFLDYAAMTPRQLLAHRSGLLNYRNTAEFGADPTSMDTPEEAVAASVRAPRSMEPGERAEYSSTNYLVLGMMLEQVTGRSYDDLLSERLLMPLRLARTTHSPPGPGTPNSATSGIVTDVRDLLRWGAAAYRDRAVISEDFAVMEDIDPASSLGPGSVGMCPCGMTAGKSWWEWIGYTGSTTSVQYSAARDMVFVIRVTDDLWQAGRFESVLALTARLDDLVTASTR